MNRLCILLLSLVLATPALANDWLPAERGDRWIDSTSVYPAVPAFDDGSARTVGVRRALGGWRLFNDFAGLGPLWVHAGTPNRIYIWNGAFAQVLVDFRDPTGLDSRRVVNLPDGERIEVMISSRGDTVRTLTGTYTDTLNLSFWIDDAQNQRTWQNVNFARGEGIVSYTIQHLGYPWGFYAVMETHELTPVQAMPRTIATPGARSAVVHGVGAYVVDGDDLSVFNLADGQLLARIAIPGNAYEVQVVGEDIVVHTWEQAGPASYAVDARRNTTRPHHVLNGNTAMWTGPNALVADGGHGVETWRFWAQTPTASIHLGHNSMGVGGADLVGDLLYVPASYPGGLYVVDVAQGTLVQQFGLNPWLNEVRVLGQRAYVGSGGLGVVDLTTGSYTHIEPDVSSLHRQDGIVYALAATKIMRFDASGAQLRETLLANPLPGKLLTVRSGNALVFVNDSLSTNQRLEWVRLAR